MGGATDGWERIQLAKHEDPGTCAQCHASMWTKWICQGCRFVMCLGCARRHECRRSRRGA